jgi:REP element-mobilizing transposase RayT
MSDLYRNKYRIPSARLQSGDYASQGMYFITICTANRECYFGNIVEARVIASRTAQTIELRPDMNLELAEFVIMPNHFHGIIMIGENAYNNPTGRYGKEDAMHRLSTTTNKDSDSSMEISANKFGPQSKNIASIMRGYKSAVTTRARGNDVPFKWQARFHDHIIRSYGEYQKIANYIINNPAQWASDKFYKP